MFGFLFSWCYFIQFLSKTNPLGPVCRLLLYSRIRSRAWTEYTILWPFGQLQNGIIFNCLSANCRVGVGVASMRKQYTCVLLTHRCVPLFWNASATQWCVDAFQELYWRLGSYVICLYIKTTLCLGCRSAVQCWCSYIPPHKEKKIQIFSLEGCRLAFQFASLQFVFVIWRVQSIVRRIQNNEVN